MRSRFRSAGVLAVSALAACARVPGGTPVAAPVAGVSTIRAGDSVRATFTTDAPRLSDRRPFHVYRFVAEQGARYIVTVRSSELDPLVRVMQNVGGISDVVVEDDDGGDGTDARARFAAANGGEYMIVVRPVGEDREGAYTLAVERAGTVTLRATAPVAVRIGETVRDTLADTAWFTFRADSGRSVRIEVRSSEVDPFVEFGRIRDGVFSSQASDDDGGAGLDARLDVEIGESGDYALRVSGVGERTSGPYTLHVRDRSAAGAPRVAQRSPLAPGTEARGRIDAASPVFDDDHAYGEWTLRAEPDRRYVITARSEDFDTYLIVGRDSADSFAQIATNDDAADLGTDSRLVFTPASPGEYVIRVRPYTAGRTGAYTLLAEPRTAPRSEPVTRRISFGERATGTFESDDAQLAGGAAFQQWRFSARKGERIEVIAASGGADPHVDVGVMVQHPEGGTRFVSLRTDGGQSRVSRALLIAPFAGEFVVRVSSAVAEETVPYTVELRRAP